jgi:hypothetical protein
MFETAITNLPPGTGFLLPETSAQKAPREKTRAQRPRTAIAKREKWPTSRRFEEPAFSSWFRRTGWWRMQRAKPVSKAKFPANRENNREFRGCSARRSFPAGKNPRAAITFGEDPYSD